MPVTKTCLVLASAIALITTNNALADFAVDADAVLNWGEKTYAQFLPEHVNTEISAPWYYRYYAKTNLYVGVNSSDNGVYLLEATPSAKPVYVDSVAHLLEKIPVLNPLVVDTPKEPTPLVVDTPKEPTPLVVDEPKNPIPLVIDEPTPTTPVQNDQPICDAATAPTGMAYSQSGSTIKATTNGQCVALPKVDMCLPASPVVNGISVLKQMEVQTYTLKGISFTDPAFAVALDPMIKSYGNIKTCIKNAPQALANVTFNLDGCFDVTDQLKDFPSIEGLVKIAPPVFMQLQGDIATEIVPDCFKTDATIITDAVTHEIWDWDKKKTSFIKR